MKIKNELVLQGMTQAAADEIVVHGFNAVQKRYLATCLRMRSTPEKDNIDSKRMRVEAMTEKG